MKRNRITIIVEVDLDGVPGWGYHPEDYVKHVQRVLDDTIGHYNPTVRLSQTHENVTNQLPTDEFISQ